MPIITQDNAVAVLVSGGLDSAVLCAEAASQYDRVYPLYVRFGLKWEAAEITWLKAFLSAIATSSLAALTVLDAPVTDIYGSHWSVSGKNTPQADAPNDADYLPGRNLLLLAKAAVWCQLRGISHIVVGTLEANPFPDATPAFDVALEQAIQLGMDTGFAIERPYRNLTKSDVLQRGKILPLELTFSCISPAGNYPCGTCIKCGERQRAFVAAGISDKTPYANREKKLCSA